MSAYGEYREFFKNGQVRQEGPFFGDFMIGIHKIYNQQGKLIDRVDFNRPFPFSVEQLIKKFKTEFKMDIVDPSKRIYVSRSATPKPYYHVFTLDVMDSGLQRGFDIDGVTGAVLSDVFIKPRD